ncbi:MAG: PTS sugar transporter subunit IIA [Phycisphaerae bacterium]|nr:PTS sugar transporter subunit IIA [Phycisphaerae bacterium]
MKKLSEVISADCIVVPMSATDKQAAIEELVQALCDAGRLTDPKPLLEAVLAREATRSTGIGQGLAIPHGKCGGLGGLVGAAGKPKMPIDFESIDGQPVNFVVLFGSDIDQTGPHIQALARLSRLMTTPSFREKISQAKTSEEVYRAFVEHEN